MKLRRVGQIGSLLAGAAVLGVWSAAEAGARAPSAVVGNPKGGVPLFRANCSSCHVLKAAHATGVVGPNLDKLKLPEAIVIAQVKRGGGVMPAYKTIFTKTQIQNVAAYVYVSTHKGA